MSPEEWLAKQQQNSKTLSPEEWLASQEKQTQPEKPSVMDLFRKELLTSPPARFVRGAVVDPALGLAQLATGGQNQMINRAVDVVAQETKPEGMDVAGFAGAVLSPFNKLSLAAKGASLAPRLMAAAGTGAAQGAIQPVEGADKGFAETKATQVVTGAALGPAFEGLMRLSGKVYQTGRNVLTENGKRQAIQDQLNSLAGPDREKAIELLRDAKELVTGSRPTAAEVLSDIPTTAELVALQKKISGEMGGAMSSFAKRDAEQAQARLDAINKIAGTPEQRSAIATRRDREAGRMRETALNQSDVAGTIVGKLEKEISDRFNSIAAAEQTSGMVGMAARQQGATAAAGKPGWLTAGDIAVEAKQRAGAYKDIAAQKRAEAQMKIMQKESLEQNGFFPLKADDLASQLESAARGTNNDMAKEIFSEFASRIRSKADANGIVSSRDIYENVRKDLNRQIQANLEKSGKTPLQGGLPEQAAKAAGNIKQFIDAAFDKSSDGLWSKYLSTYSQYSQKIDRMRIGEELSSRLNTALDAESAGTFARAVENAAQTVKRAGTDIPRYQRLNQLMTPTEMSTINSVVADLKRKARSEQLAQGAGAIPEVADKAKLPPFLSSTITVVNNMLDALQRGNKAEYNKFVSTLMLDPPKLAQFMTTQIPKGKVDELVTAMTKGMDEGTKRAFIQSFTVKPVTGAMGEE